MTRDFRWNDWNLDHATQHGVFVEDAEHVVRFARRPFPRDIGDEKWLVWGRTARGLLVQVIYTLDPDRTIYIIHARPLMENEKRRFRRQ